MAIYTSVGGVVRQLDHLDTSRYNIVNHVPIWKAGVSGVVRNLMDITDQIDYVEIDVNSIRTYTINSNGEHQSDDGYDLATAQKSGSVTIGSNYIIVSCTKILKTINLDYFVHLVFKDGHKASLIGAKTGVSGDITFSLSVSGSEYFDNEGFYHNYCMGLPVIEGYVWNSSSNTITITDSTNGYCSLLAGRSAYGTTTSQQQFNSITINGKLFPIKIINNLQ